MFVLYVVLFVFACLFSVHAFVEVGLLKRFLIVGVDPGTTTAFAAIDLNGKPVRVESGREMSREGVVKGIEHAGVPIVVACDVNPAPDFAAKIAAAFNCKLFVPSKNLSEEEKRKLVQDTLASQDCGLRTQNTHESDALASAINAFHFLENKFRKVERVLSELGLGDKADEAKQLVASGVRLDDAVKLFELESEAKKAECESPPEKTETTLHQRPPLQRQFGELRYLVVANAELKKQVERLENENKLLEERLSRVQRSAFAEAMRDKKIRALESQVSRLRMLLQNFFEKRKKKRELGLKSLAGKAQPDLEKIVQEHRLQSTA